jgi:hypothetical protein
MNHLASPEELDDVRRLRDRRPSVELADARDLVLERTVRTAITVPAWATADQVAEAMEILDPTAATDWHGVLPGWGATTIYAAPETA